MSQKRQPSNPGTVRSKGRMSAGMVTGSPLLKRARYKIEWAGVAVASALLPKLPRRLLLALADVCGLVFHYADARSRRVAIANLEAAFGEKYSPAERHRIARASAKNLARTFFDLFWVSNLTPKNWQQLIDSENASRFLTVPQEAGVGAVFVCHHFGNWEWLVQVAGFTGADMVFVAQQFKNPSLENIFRRLREHSGCRQIQRNGALLRLVKALKSGVSTGMLTDLTVPPEQSAVVIEGFGMKMCVTSAPAALRRKLGCPIVPSVSLPSADGRLRTVHLEPLQFRDGASDAEVMQACWDALEPYIRQRPELWLWAYKHWRFRPANTQHRYPFYANASNKFERLLARQQSIAPTQALQPTQNQGQRGA